MRLLRVVVVLALLAVAGLAAYAYLGDMTPQRREVRVPVSLTGEPLPKSAPPAKAEAPVDAATEATPATDTAGTPAGAADDLD